MELLESTVICSDSESETFSTPFHASSPRQTTPSINIPTENRVEPPLSSSLGTSPANSVMKPPLPTQTQNIDNSELECSLCFRLFCKPVSTPCGHTYCKSCLLASLKFSQNCPLCRSKLEPSTKHKYSVNIVILTLIEKHFKEEYDQREKEEAEDDEQDAAAAAIGENGTRELEDIYTRWSNCLLPSVRETCSVLLSCT
eukprot:TRINITY_DN555_c0_g1_i1.p1 TRINITY_DN555_c0_g1~~TRINITY_DN555_c0_g1_i1.p1  ORF type:complete len:199 (-),score=34.17 TRINITY_DN555_c0_g1_i1:116-712(-)